MRIMRKIVNDTLILVVGVSSALRKLVLEASSTPIEVAI